MVLSMVFLVLRSRLVVVVVVVWCRFLLRLVVLMYCLMSFNLNLCVLVCVFGLFW